VVTKWRYGRTVGKWSGDIQTGSRGPEIRRSEDSGVKGKGWLQIVTIGMGNRVRSIGYDNYKEWHESSHGLIRGPAHLVWWVILYYKYLTKHDESWANHDESSRNPYKVWWLMSKHNVSSRNPYKSSPSHMICLWKNQVAEMMPNRNKHSKIWSPNKNKQKCGWRKHK
jgi:hypothetical protein